MPNANQGDLGPIGDGLVLPDPPDVSAGYVRSERRRLAIEALGASVGVGVLAGAVAGFVWGGVGGRVAMRIVLLTSDDRVRGLTSDDGFEIGVISAATVFLLIFTTILGAIAGLIYGFSRMLLKGPRWIVAIAVGIAAGAGGGALIVHTDGIDFHILEPLALTVGLFVLIPAAWGVTVVLLAERLLRPRTVLPNLPPMARRRLGGFVASAIAWLALAAITAMGLVSLVRDIEHLS